MSGASAAPHPRRARSRERGRPGRARARASAERAEPSSVFAPVEHNCGPLCACKARDGDESVSPHPSAAQGKKGRGRRCELNLGSAGATRGPNLDRIRPKNNTGCLKYCRPEYLATDGPAASDISSLPAQLEALRGDLIKEKRRAHTFPHCRPDLPRARALGSSAQNRRCMYMPTHTRPLSADTRCADRER